MPLDLDLALATARRAVEAAATASLAHFRRGVRVEVKPDRTPVTAAMNPKPHKVKLDDEIADVAKLMEDRKLNGVLVVNDKGDLAGLLTTTNALEALIWFSQLASKLD